MAWSAQRDGFETEDIDPWDSHITLTATVRAVLTTGHAIFLSALTTIIGFSVLRWPSLVPIGADENSWYHSPSWNCSHFCDVDDSGASFGSIAQI